MKRAIIIMAKVPRAGNVKTRLQPFLSAEQCVSLSEAFLEDAIEKAKKSTDILIIAFSPAEEREYFDKFSDENLILIEQNGADLGEKMFNAFDFAFQKNLDSVVMIGTDSPTFPDDYLKQAFEFLHTSDAVLGKTEDGGFYLIGLRKLDECIFNNVEWSSPQTFHQTVQNLEKLQFSLQELPIWYDIDEPQDLEKLRKDKLLQKSSPRSAKWLQNLKQ